MKLRLTDTHFSPSGIADQLLVIPRLEVSSKSNVLIQGPSGKGKTSFLNLISGLIRPQAGEILWDDHPLHSMSPNESALFRRKFISFIFQKLNLIEHLTIEENLSLGQFTAVSTERIEAILEVFEMQNHRKKLASQLSQGEQQRIAVARALLNPGQIILADEVTSSLDHKNADKIMSQIFESTKERTLIFVSHDHRVESYFDKKIQFEDVCQ